FHPHHDFGRRVERAGHSDQLRRTGPQPHLERMVGPDPRTPRRVNDSGLAFALRQVGDEAELPLLPAEIAAARPRRRAEYAAGRIAARAALRRLTGQAALIGMGPDRLPLWPKGTIGSISHNR